MHRIVLWLCGLLVVMGCGAAPEASLPAGVVVGNTHCPVSGAPAAGEAMRPSFPAVHRGFVIGFMCPVHRHEFETASDDAKDAWLSAARQDAALARALK